MKRLFVETRYEGNLTLPESILNQLPKVVVLAMPVQFLDFLKKIKKQLESAGKKVILFKGQHSKYLGQILGCDVFEFKGNYDGFLYVGDGRFHPTALLYGNKKPVYAYNPFSQKMVVYDNSDLEKLEKKRKGLLAKFLSSNHIGILVSTKLGQNKLNLAEQLKEKLEKEGKKAFVFLADDINFSGLENFNFIESWVNTACPRLNEDFNCLNIEDLK